MKKIVLVAGCSHAAGSEINGLDDSRYNRVNSFGNQLAYKMGYEPINIALNGSANPSIARSVLHWFDKFYDPTTMTVFPVVAWTESIRMEIPGLHKYTYRASSKWPDYFDETSELFMRINMGFKGSKTEEIELIEYFHDFIPRNETFLEILSANLALQLQYFFKMHKLNYVMCNTMHMFTFPSETLETYTGLLDKSKYMAWDNNEESFFWKYRKAGYENPKAKYWHHNEVPHSLYADELYKFIGANQCF
jgi:hypothetical protein